MTCLCDEFSKIHIEQSHILFLFSSYIAEMAHNFVHFYMTLQRLAQETARTPLSMENSAFESVDRSLYSRPHSRRTQWANTIGVSCAVWARDSPYQRDGVKDRRASYCFWDSKQAEQAKQAISYTYKRCLGHRPPQCTSPPPIRRTEEAPGGIRAPGRVTRTAPKPANSLLSRRQEQKEWEGGSKETNAMRMGLQWAVTILNSMADGQALPPLISLVPGTSPPVMQGSLVAMNKKFEEVAPGDGSRSTLWDLSRPRVESAYRMIFPTRWSDSGDSRIPRRVLALSQRLSPLDLIFRSSTPTSDKILLINFRISWYITNKILRYRMDFALLTIYLW